MKRFLEPLRPVVFGLPWRQQISAVVSDLLQLHPWRFLFPQLLWGIAPTNNFLIGHIAPTMSMHPFMVGGPEVHRHTALQQQKLLRISKRRRVVSGAAVG